MSDIRHEIHIQASQEIIYSLLSEDIGIRKWWGEKAEENKDGISLSFNGKLAVFQLTPKLANAPKRVEWFCESKGEWRDSRLIFSITLQDDYTKLRFIHFGCKGMVGESVVQWNTRWVLWLLRIKAIAENKKIDNQPHPLEVVRS